MLKLYKSGRLVDPLHLRPMDLDIRDIAWNLSLICRYTGSFPFHYSVAQHSILVADLMKRDHHEIKVQLAGLLHDAAEYVMGDVNFHLKKLPELADYNRREHQCSQMILKHYDINPVSLDIVKPYDREAAHIEMAVRDGTASGILPYDPGVIYHRFLLKFEELSGNDLYDHSTFSLPSSL